METFIPPKPFIEYPEFAEKRAEALHELDNLIRLAEPDPPLIPLIRLYMPIASCFTVQSCYGHFVSNKSPDDKNLFPISSLPSEMKQLCYRLAYVVFCIKNDERGHALYEDLQSMTEIDPMNIQFGSASWFWNMIPNTYVVQLEPLRGACQDTVRVTFDEAIYLESLRGRFFGHLTDIAHKSMTN